ncbi:hypothetical protein [Streptomyces sp. ISL-12]|uniref:hypothetical protein n=1 Tax=Streptomyces sp. ISL-12 TaxID=2819177 RepID=UPI0027E0D237|nr:hypothetical protein [Streptomyces sp. ISL-12]
MEKASTVIYRHHIAPPRAFTQFSHDLIRHPRLSSDAVRLLTWQLSLPEGTRESLSRTAERARIGATAFTRAKRQLKEEGFVHERRVQGPGGHWITQQLVSSTPLNAAEAAKLLARAPVAVSPQVVPSPRKPAVGAPTPPPTDRHPDQDLGENTSHQPPEPPARASEEARALVAAFPTLSPALSHIPRAMHGELAALTDRWLAAGHPPTAVRTHILRGLPGDGAPVHRPGGLLRYLLREVPPVPDQHPGIPGPQAAPATSSRLSALRECEGDHVQATLFRPVGDETRCTRCTETPPAPTEPGRLAVPPGQEGGPAATFDAWTPSALPPSPCASPPRPAAPGSPGGWPPSGWTPGAGRTAAR